MFVGGLEVDLARVAYRAATAVWWHPGDHPAFATHIRFGRLVDGRWYVRQTAFPSVEYAFDRRDDAELAVLKLLDRCRDGQWVVKVAAGGPGAPVIRRPSGRS